MGRGGAIRGAWFPAVLCLAIAANVGMAIRWHGAVEPAVYRLAVRQDDSLEAALPEGRGGHGAIIRHMLGIEAALGGATLVVPADLGLRPKSLRMWGGVEMRERRRARIGGPLARVLRAESRDVPLHLAGRQLYVARDLRPPWTEPVHVLARRNDRELYVVSPTRLALLPASLR